MRQPLAALLLLSTPVVADEGCAFVSQSGWRADFQPSGLAVQIHHPAHQTEHCWVTNEDPNVGQNADFVCGDKAPERVEFFGEDHAAWSVMIFRDQVFELTCWDTRV